MAATIETSIVLSKPLFDQAEMLAQRLNISSEDFFARAIETFIRDSQDQLDLNKVAALPQPVESSQRINQGDVYWLQVDDTHEGDASIRHPHVVIQENVLNHSRIPTVVVCALTSNLKRVNMPGNVLLDSGEANLSKQSIVEVSKVSSIDKTQLGDYIGTLSEQRAQQILAGLRFLQASFL
jgi:mRNA interferase MazF